MVCLLFALACSGILGTPLEQMERSYNSRVETMESLKERAAGEEALIQEIDQTLSGFQTQYDALPTEEESRANDLGTLNKAMRDARRKLEAKVETVEAAALQVAEAEGAKIRSTFNGTWMAPGISLVIDPSGQVHYENNSTGVNKSLEAPIQSFTDKRFTVGVFGIVTTFVIDTPPYQDENGVWKMKLDGIEYTRQ
jgi:hypothetical protein